MFRDGRVLALIPARGGSKTLPRKNVLPLGGKPMIAWSCEAARAVPEIDQLIVSSDDAEILQAARDAGAEAPFVRPPHLAADDSTTFDVAAHAIANVAVPPEWLVLLQPTSPLRKADDIARGFATLQETGADSVVSLAPSPKSPFWMYTLDENNRMDPILDVAEARAASRRQELPDVFVLNGAVYILRVSTLLAQKTFVSRETVGFVMPAERSVDVDTALDFALCEAIFRQRG